MSFTLRHHTCGVTAVIPWIRNGETSTLISGDKEGNIIVWNLLVRRPIYRYECKGQVVYLQQVDHYLFVTCKDYTLRILTIPDSTNKQINQSRNVLPELTLVYEIPVNTTNFANAVVEQLSVYIFRLWCCNTQDSESIDIYEFDIRDAKSLTRLYKGVSLYKYIAPLVDSSMMKFNKLGMIMRFSSFNGVIYIGFESGFLLGLYLQNGRLHLGYISSVHYPEPVLDLTVSEELHKVISSSTSSELGFHMCKPPQQNSITNSSQNTTDVTIDTTVIHSDRSSLPISKVSHVKQVDGLIVTAGWSGVTEVFDVSTHTHLKSIMKERGQVSIDHNPYGTDGSVEFNTRARVLSMTCIPKSEPVFIYEMSEGERRRLTKFSKISWCLIGFEDGSILAKDLNANELITI